MAERRYIGWRKEPEDRRDYKLSVPIRITLPPSVDLREYASPNQNQYSTSSCVGNACANALELLHIKEFGKEHHDDMSRLFIYWNARDYIGETRQDAGCFIRDAIKGMARYGTPYEKTWPFDQRYVTLQPNKKAYDEAEKHQILKYYRISETDRVYQVQYALSQGFPVVFGMKIFESFEKTGRDGKVPVPNPAGEEFLGGHAMCIEGYDPERFIVENSWGKNWGDAGYALVPKEVVESPSLSSDYWVIQIVEDDQVQVERPAWHVLITYWLRRIFYLKERRM
jgi:C1A family cysteine protease